MRLSVKTTRHRQKAKRFPDLSLAGLSVQTFTLVQIFAARSDFTHPQTSPLSTSLRYRPCALSMRTATGGAVPTYHLMWPTHATWARRHSHRMGPARHDGRRNQGPTARSHEHITLPSYRYRALSPRPLARALLTEASLSASHAPRIQLCWSADDIPNPVVLVFGFTHSSHNATQGLFMGWGGDASPWRLPPTTGSCPR